MEIVFEMKIEMTHQIFVVIVLYFTILNRTGFRTIVTEEQKTYFLALVHSVRGHGPSEDKDPLYIFQVWVTSSLSFDDEKIALSI